MNERRTNELTDSSKENVRASELILQDLSRRIINDLDTWHWNNMQWRDTYLQELNGSDKFPNKIAYDMIKAWRGKVVLKWIDKFEPTQTLANALLKDMLKNWFYKDIDNDNPRFHKYMLSDQPIERENFLSRFNDLDNTTALLALNLINKNNFKWANCIYKEHLGDCFNLKHFTNLDEEILKRISERWKIPTDEEKEKFFWIDDEKREKYTAIALAIQEGRDNEWDNLAEESRKIY